MTKDTPTVSREAPRSVRLRPSTWARLITYRDKSGDTLDDALNALLDNAATKRPRVKGRIPNGDQ